MVKRADDILVIQAQGGDRAAFGSLAERYQGMAMSVARRIVGSEDDARDLVQEALLQAYLSLGRLRQEGSFASWLHGIVRNVCLNHVRERRPLFFVDPTADTTDEVFRDPDRDLHEVMEARELEANLRRAIDVLASPQRSVTEMFYWQGLSLQEIADRLGLSVTAVKSRLFKSRGRLREQMAASYPELKHLRQRRRKKMVRVSIADIVPAPMEGYYFAMLLDEATHRVLPVLVLTRRTGMQYNLKKNPQVGMESPDLLADVLESTGIELQEVRIAELSDGLLCATLAMQNGDIASEVEARPDEALALAAGRECPIYVDADVLKKEAQTIPEALRAPENRIQALVAFAYDFNFGAAVSELFGRVVRYAREEAARLGGDQVDSEHLLLGILRAAEGTAATILKRLDQDFGELRRFVEENVARPASGSADDALIPFAPRTQQILSEARKEANQMRAEVIGTGHLLLALCSETQGAASMVLALKGILHTNVRHWPLRGEDPVAFWQD